MLCASDSIKFIIGIVVAEKDTMHLNDEALRRLPKLSHDHD